MTGHLGNYDAARALLLAQGFKVAGFYMPMRNPAFNTRYVAAISRIGTPVFARGRDGLVAMLRFLRQGGMVGAGRRSTTCKHGELLDFMGQPARTALSAAEMALKYKALLVPVYGIRQPDGLNFSVRIEAPIPHSDPLTMTKALNKSLETLVRQHMDQWMWTHRRWKKKTAPRMSPDYPFLSTGLGLSSYSSVKMRWLSPSGSSYMPLRRVQMKAPRPSRPRISETGIRMVRTSMNVFTSAAARST